MAQELLYTSAPQGLKAGGRGFCTVEATAGMSPALAAALEGLSGYRHVAPAGDPANPVVRSHVTFALGGRAYSVVSRVADAGTDYTGRTNKIAHHLALDPTERPKGGPAWLLGRPETSRATFDGEPKTLPPRTPPAGDRPPGVCVAWQAAAGDAGWAGVLAEAFLADPTRPAYLVVPPGLDVLPLFEEAIALLPPDQRWSATFTTSMTSLPHSVICRWRAVIAGSKEAHESQRFVQAWRMDLTATQRAAAGGLLVTAARTGDLAVIAKQLPPGPRRSAVGSLPVTEITEPLDEMPLIATTPAARPVRLSDSLSPPKLPPAKRSPLRATIFALTLLLLCCAMGLGVWWQRTRSSFPRLGEPVATTNAVAVQPKKAEPSHDASEQNQGKDPRQPEKSVVPTDGESSPGDAVTSADMEPGPTPPVSPAKEGLETNTPRESPADLPPEVGAGPPPRPVPAEAETSENSEHLVIASIGDSEGGDYPIGGEGAIHGSDVTDLNLFIPEGFGDIKSKLEGKDLVVLHKPGFGKWTEVGRFLVLISQGPPRLYYRSASERNKSPFDRLNWCVLQVAQGNQRSLLAIWDRTPSTDYGKAGVTISLPVKSSGPLPDLSLVAELSAGKHRFKFETPEAGAERVVSQAFGQFLVEEFDLDEPPLVTGKDAATLTRKAVDGATPAFVITKTEGSVLLKAPKDNVVEPLRPKVNLVRDRLYGLLLTKEIGVDIKTLNVNGASAYSRLGFEGVSGDDARDAIDLVKARLAAKSQGAGQSDAKTSSQSGEVSNRLNEASGALEELDRIHRFAGELRASTFIIKSAAYRTRGTDGEERVVSLLGS